MKKILIGIFKRWFCFIPAVLFWLIAVPFNVMSITVPQGIWWFITGRDLMDDGFSFISWVMDIK